MNPFIRDGAAALITKYGEVPEYVKYDHEGEIVFGKVESFEWEDPYFILDIVHSKKIIEAGSWRGMPPADRLSRSWPFHVVGNGAQQGQHIRMEIATEAEYMMSLIMES